MEKMNKRRKSSIRSSVTVRAGGELLFSGQ